jgi:hypothetical protein
MISSLTRRLTFANVVSVLALSISLGGVSYAAVTLPGNSVGSKQLKRSAVTLPKIAPAALRALSGKQGLSGQRGPTGTTGATGPSDGFATGHPGPLNIVGTTAGFPPMPAELGHLDVPAGAFEAVAQVRVYNGTASVMHVTCSITAGADSQASDVFITPTPNQNAVVLPVVFDHLFAAAGRIDFSCVAVEFTGTGDSLQATEVRLSAVRLGSLTLQ